MFHHPYDMNTQKITFLVILLKQCCILSCTKTICCFLCYFKRISKTTGHKPYGSLAFSLKFMQDSVRNLKKITWKLRNSKTVVHTSVFIVFLHQFMCHNTWLSTFFLILKISSTIFKNRDTTIVSLHLHLLYSPHGLHRVAHWCMSTALELFTMRNLIPEQISQSAGRILSCSTQLWTTVYKQVTAMYCWMYTELCNMPMHRMTVLPQHIHMLQTKGGYFLIAFI